MSRRSLLRVLFICAVAALGLIAAPASNAAAALLSGTVSGQPLGKEVAPVAGVRVTVTPAEGGEAIATTTTSAKGNYSLFVPEGTFNVGFEPPEGSGLKSTTVEKVGVGSSRLLEVVLFASELAHLTGTLRDAAGEPIAGAAIKMTGSSPTVETETNPEGFYSFTVPTGEYVLDVSGSGAGHPDVPVRFSFSTEGFFLDANENRNMTLPSTSTVTVEVQLSEEPIREALVSLPEYRTGEVLLGGFLTTQINASGQLTTGADGRAPFPIFDGSTLVSKSALGQVILPSGKEGSTTTFAAPTPVTEDVTLLEPAPTIVHLKGTIRDAAGNPVPRALVTILGEKAVQETETNAEGFYSLTTVPGEYGTEIEGHGGGLPTTWSIDTGVDLHRSQERNITLPPTSTLAVEVLGTHGSPVPGATVSIPTYVSQGGNYGGFPTDGAHSSPLPVVTGANGRAAFLVFDGSPIKVGFHQIPRPGEVEPPSGSGYPVVEFMAPSVTESTTQIVRLAGSEEVKEEEEVPPKEEEAGIEGPELTELFFEAPEIDTSEKGSDVRIFARLKDGDGGIEKGYVTFDRPNGEERIYGYLERVSEGESGTVLEGNAIFPRESEDGRWLATVHAFDSTGHELILGPEELGARGFVNAVTVVNSEPRVPGVTGISPTSGPEAGGTKVVISGSGFSGVEAVRFGESKAEFEIRSAEEIVAYAPPGKGNVGVVVETAGGVSNERNFAYLPAVVVSLASSPNPSVRGQKVTFTATVSPSEGGATPVGTVAFVEGTSTLGVANLSKGVAKLSTTTLGAGEHPIVAEYSGDSNYGEAQSSSLTQVVGKASSEVTLSSSLDPAPFGSSGTLKAHVAAIAPGAGTPAGTVTFREGETVLDTVQLSAGNASLSLKALEPGTHKISASYSGDANDKASEAGPLTQTVTEAATELALTSTLNPAPFGSSATLKATVKAVAPGGGTPAGTVTFREGETVLAIVPLSAGSARYALKTTAPGEHPITATYSGEADYEGSSGSLVQAIVAASTELSLTSTKNPAPHGSTGTLKATVKAIAPGAGTPTGTVTFREDETVLAIVPLSGSAATYPLKSLTVGEHKVTATYNGSADYEASEASIAQVITG